MRSVYQEFSMGKLTHWLRKDGNEMASAEEELAAQREEYESGFVKTCVLGERGAGKESFVCRFVEGVYRDREPRFDIRHAAPWDFRHIRVGCEGKNLKVQLWYEMNQDLYKRFQNPQVQRFFSAMQGFIVCYDIHQPKEKEAPDIYQQRRNGGLESVRNILIRIAKDCDLSPPFAAVFIVGCKSDLAGQRETTYEEGQAIADEWSPAPPGTENPGFRFRYPVLYGECSAKSGFGVEGIMARHLRQVHLAKMERILGKGPPEEPGDRHSDRQCHVS